MQTETAGSDDPAGAKEILADTAGSDDPARAKTISCINCITLLRALS
jgi:hypothetical protein